MTSELKKLNARLNAAIARTGYTKPKYTPVMTGNSKVLADSLTEQAQIRNINITPATRKIYSIEEIARLREMALEMMTEELGEETEEVIELEASAETIEKSMIESAQEIEQEKATNKLDPEYVKYVKQFSPEIVERLIGSEEAEESEEVEEGKLVITREAKTTEAIRNEYKTFVSKQTPYIANILTPLTSEDENFFKKIQCRRNARENGEKGLVLTREETYGKMMEAAEELREEVEDMRLNEEEVEIARREYKSFVELYAPKLIDIKGDWNGFFLRDNNTRTSSHRNSLHDNSNTVDNVRIGSHRQNTRAYRQHGEKY